MTPDVAEAMGLTDAKGALVTDVPDGPAKDAGMQAGDVITTFDGVRRGRHARADPQGGRCTDVGKAVPVVVLRDGKTETLTITLGRREEAEAEAVPAAAARHGRAGSAGTAGPDRDAADRRRCREAGPAGTGPKGWW